MILEFDRGLHTQKIYAHGEELAKYLAKDRDESGQRVHRWPDSSRQLVATLNDPVLVTDFPKICKEQQNPTVRDTVLALYSSANRMTQYDGTSLEFIQQNYPTVWGPSIDTLLFCKALDEKHLAGVKNAIEIGCGSGFISKYILEHAPTLKSMTLVDIDQNAIWCATEAIQDDRVLYHMGNGQEFLTGKKFDLIVCNPPYIPRPRSVEDNPYEGTQLLNYLMTHPEHLNEDGKIITNYSSLCEDHLDDAMKHSPMKLEVLETKEVPLKVMNVLNNPSWMEFLTKEKGLKQEMRDGYEYWHTIHIVQVSAR